MSVDVLRGLTILLMVFVNDLGHAAPAWMHHIRPARADGMTLADIVFPFFLFIVGVAIPLAFERAESLGISRWAQFGHILIRSGSLLILGVIELNSDEDHRLGSEVWSHSCVHLCVAGVVRPAACARLEAQRAAHAQDQWVSSVCSVCWPFTGARLIPLKCRCWVASRTGLGCGSAGGASSA